MTEMKKKTPLFIATHALVKANMVSRMRTCLKWACLFESQPNHPKAKTHLLKNTRNLTDEQTHLLIFTLLHKELFETAFMLAQNDVICPHDKHGHDIFFAHRRFSFTALEKKTDIRAEKFWNALIAHNLVPCAMTCGWNWSILEPTETVWEWLWENTQTKTQIEKVVQNNVDSQIFLSRFQGFTFHNPTPEFLTKTGETLARLISYTHNLFGDEKSLFIQIETGHNLKKNQAFINTPEDTLTLLLAGWPLSTLAKISAHWSLRKNTPYTDSPWPAHILNTLMTLHHSQHNQILLKGRLHSLPTDIRHQALTLLCADPKTPLNGKVLTQIQKHLFPKPN